MTDFSTAANRRQKMANGFTKLTLASAIGAALVVAGCGGGDDPAQAGPTSQPPGSSGTPATPTYTQAVIGAKSKTVLTVDGFQFKDLNANGKLDPYEDWRLAPDARAADLVARMTLAEKAGLVNANNMVPIGGNYPSEEIGGAPACDAGELGKKYICEITTSGSWGATRMLNEFNGRYFIIRSNPQPRVLAAYLNNFQQIAEESRLGIPAVIASNPRNHAAAGLGLSEAAGVFSYWPGTLGLAATQDPALVRDFAETAAKEWRSTGIRKGYMYQIELATEPRWTRNNGTFGEDPDLVAKIAKELVLGFQGTKLGPDSIALTVKHYPGNGIAPRGIDSHGAEGKFAVYPTAGSLIAYQLKGFQAAIDAGASSIMTNYQAPKNAGSKDQLPKTFWYSLTQQFEEVAEAYNAKLIEYALKVMGHKGYLNTDSNVALDSGEPWGVETLKVHQRVAKSLNAGISLLSLASANLGSATPTLGNAEVIRAINEGLTSEATLNKAAQKLLNEMFQLGIFENPYVDPEVAAKVVHSAEAQAKADLAQRKSVVLLKNDGDVLPLAKTANASVKIYSEVFAKSNAATLTTNLRAKLALQYPGAQMVTDYNLATHAVLVVLPSTFTGTDALGQFIKIAMDTDTGIDVARIKAIEAKAKTIISVNMGQPWLLNEIEPGASAILATYDVTSDALFDVISGAFKPTGRLPMGIPKDQAAVDANAPDVPGNYESFDYAYKDAKNSTYKFGFGLNYK
jgi:beta-glucosidase